MKTATAMILLLSTHLTIAQLNFEGNPLTEHTEYLAEESHLSERSSRQNSERSINDLREMNQVSSKEIYQPGTLQKLYPVFSKDTGHEVFQVNSGINTVRNSVSIQNSNSVQSTKPIQNAEPVEVVKLVQVVEPEKKPRLLQDNFINTNAIQQEQNRQQQTINPADLALHIFMNSKTPKESEVALGYYLQGGQGLTEQLELQQQQQIREKEFQQQQLRQEQIQQEMIQNQQQQLKQEQMLHQVQQEHLQQQQIQQQRTQQLKQLEQEHLNQDQLFRQQVQHNQFQNPQQIQQNQFQNRQHIQQNQFQNAQQIQQNQFQNQQIQPQQPIVDPLPQSVPQVSGPYTYPAPQIPFIQPRNDFIPGPPIYRRPMRRTNYRQPVPLQSRIGPGIYKGLPPPPTFPGKMVKPPVEVIYSRSPSYARGPPVHYENASPWFPESDHQPSAKDIYYSQLYAQSYDPHYYNYIAKTGKIKPHLYGKLNREEKQDDGILAELFRGFAKHGIKNIMNPTFLLGMTIPALTFMLTALVQKRSLARSDSRSFDEEEIREYLERLQKALECYRNSKVPTDHQCWQ